MNVAATDLSTQVSEEMQPAIFRPNDCVVIQTGCSAL